MAVEVERWGVVREVEDVACGVEGVATLDRVDLLEFVELRREDGMWYPAPLEGLGHTSPRVAVALVALHSGWSIVEVCDPARVEAIERGALWSTVAPLPSCAVAAVELRLSEGAARAWLKLLAQWSGGGTLGEPGDELRAELARALGEGGAG